MGKKLYVGNLTYKVSSSELEQLFSQFGTVQSAQVITDRDTGRSKGFGFVEMDTEAEAQEAIRGLHDQDHNGRRLTVNEARPREPRPGGGGRRRIWRWRWRSWGLWWRRWRRPRPILSRFTHAREPRESTVRATACRIDSARVRIPLADQESGQIPLSWRGEEPSNKEAVGTSSGGFMRVDVTKTEPS